MKIKDKNEQLLELSNKLRDWINTKMIKNEIKSSYEWHMELMFQFAGRAYQFYKKLDELKGINPDYYNILMDEFPAMSRDGLDITLTSMSSITSLALLELVEKYLANFCELSNIKFELIDIYKLENLFNHNEHQKEIMETAFKLIDEFIDYPEYDKKTMFFLKLGEIIFPTLTKDAKYSDLTLKITTLKLIWEEAKTIKRYSLVDLEKAYVKMEQELPDDDPKFVKQWAQINEKLDDISIKLESVTKLLNKTQTKTKKVKKELKDGT